MEYTLFIPLALIVYVLVDICLYYEFNTKVPLTLIYKTLILIKITNFKSNNTLKYNLVFAKIKKDDGVVFGSMIISKYYKLYTNSNIVQPYYARIIDPKYNYIIIDLSAHKKYTNNKTPFNLRISYTFLHELRHIYQYSINRKLFSETVSYKERTCEKDAHQYAISLLNIG